MSRSELIDDTFSADSVTGSTVNSQGETTVSSVAKTVVTAMGEVAPDGAIVKLN